MGGKNGCDFLDQFVGKMFTIEDNKSGRKIKS